MTENELAGPSIAILVANGFNENQVTAVQRALTNASVKFKIVAPEQGLVNGWQDNAWGHYFTVDEMISTAMGSDYDFLFLIGGERGVAKLKTNPHTRRIVNHFLEAEKPVAAIEAGVELLALSPKSASLTVSAPEACGQALVSAQIELVAEDVSFDRHVLTSAGGDITAWVEKAVEMLSTCIVNDEQAQAA
ncbi:MAG: DJ-1/PfpI family protein [Alphaproteobacteria bacterium]|jgi:protease I|nr:DJ-1/PfpI family protein [Alphaproteobacteria bacterium]